MNAAASVDRAASERIARRLRAMADPTRVQILSLILAADGGRRAVTELAASLGLSQPTVSHHLRVMADEGILEGTPEGRQVWYSVAPDRLTEVFDAISVDSVSVERPPTRPALDRIAADLSVRFAGTFSPETVGEVVQSSFDLLAGRARITRFLPSLTSRFASERLTALAASTEGGDRSGTPVVLFVCVQNAGRSQMASAILRALAGDRLRVHTAGSQPAGSINPKVVAALDEVGISIDGEYPKPLTDELVRAADVVVTMGCGDACPVYPGRRYLDWELPDPAALSMDGVRAVRDDIDSRVRSLLHELA